MYLNQINRTQKELFLDLCMHAAMSNNIFEDKEKEIIEQYCEEMRIPFRYEAKVDLDIAVDRLVEISSERELRMIFLELIALVLADDELDESEQRFVNAFAEKIEVTHEEIKDLIVNLKELANIYNRINLFVDNHA